MEATDLGQAGLMDFVPLTLTGQEPATNIQNEIDGSGSGEPSGARDPRRTAEHEEGGEPSGGRDPRRTEGGDGEGQEETCGRADGGEASGAREPRRTCELPAPLPEQDCVAPPRVQEPLSKRERRRLRREMARKEHERRSGVKNRKSPMLP